MSALEEALRHSNNRPAALVRWLHSELGATTPLNGLNDASCNICDFRHGLEEKNPSLSVRMGSEGATFKRFGGDNFKGGAVPFIASCLNVDEKEAAKMLIDRAGIIDTPRGPISSGERKTTKPAPALVMAEEKVSKLSPLPANEHIKRLRGWVKIEAGEDTQEALEAARRGLDNALLSGALVAYRFTGEVSAKAPNGKKFTVNRVSYIKDHALAYEVRGPDGKVWALKARNPDPLEDGVNRYVYLGKGQSTPAWCSPNHTRKEHVIIEGELSGAAVWEALEASDMKGLANVQGIAGVSGYPHLSPIKAGHAVYIYADEDSAGQKARKTWGDSLTAKGAKVYQLPAGIFGDSPDLDACDALKTHGAGALGLKLLEAIKGAKLHAPEEGEGDAGDVWVSHRTGYGVRAGRLCALTKKTDPNTNREDILEESLCEFEAYIQAEATLEDGGGEAVRVFEVVGARSSGQPFKQVRIPAGEFGAMNWPMKEWGASAIVHAGNGKKDKLREAIQQLSEARGREDKTVYLHTGWINHPIHGAVYLTAGACIGAAGGVEGLEVDLGKEGNLKDFALPNPAKEELRAIREAVRDSLALLDLVPDSLGVPVLGAVYRAPLGRFNAVVFPVGKTGNNKTAFLVFAQNHYGAKWTDQHLPEAWGSTGNFLEKSSYLAKDVLFIIDDFKPKGARSEVEKQHAQISKIISGVADGKGRGRMGADGKLKAGFFPRGLIMSSAESTPRGHSDLARMVVIEVRKKLVDSLAKSEAFYGAADKGREGVYALALAAYIQGLAGGLDTVEVGSKTHRERIRTLAPCFEGAHGRTGRNAAELAYGWEVFLSFAVAVGAITEHEAGKLWGRVGAALSATSEDQGDYLKEADPIERALRILSGLLSSGKGYLEDLKTGLTPPSNIAPMCGYQRREDQNGGESFYPRSGGKLLGWYAKEGGDSWAFFDPEVLHAALQDVAMSQGVVLEDSSKLYTNMRDTLHPRGLMRCQEEKGRKPKTTCKVTVQGGRRNVIGLRFPIDEVYQEVGTVGTVGTNGEERTSSTDFNTVPKYLYKFNLVGTVGTIEDPYLPSEEDLEEWTL